MSRCSLTEINLSRYRVYQALQEVGRLLASYAIHANQIPTTFHLPLFFAKNPATLAIFAYHPVP
jgi:hypothetical protein